MGEAKRATMTSFVGELKIEFEVEQVHLICSLQVEDINKGSSRKTDYAITDQSILEQRPTIEVAGIYESQSHPASRTTIVFSFDGHE